MKMPSTVINDENFMTLPNASKLQSTNDTCVSKKYPLQQIPILGVSCSSYNDKYPPENIIDNDYKSYWKPADGLPSGEWIELTVPECYPRFVDILFEQADKRECALIVLNNKKEKLFAGAFMPTKNTSTPVRCVCLPSEKTDILRIKTLYYTVSGEGGKGTSYPNPAIAEVRIIGYLPDYVSPHDPESPAPDPSQIAYFTEPPQGYVFPPTKKDPHVSFGELKSKPKFLTPDNVIGISAIEDQKINEMNQLKTNDVKNVTKIPYDDKYSAKGVGSSIILEYKKAKLENYVIRPFQCPPRSYQLMVKIYDGKIGMKSLADLESNPTSYQKIINIPSGMGDPIEIPIDPILYKDTGGGQKSLVVTMLKTSSPQLWFSVLDFYATGQQN